MAIAPSTIKTLHWTVQLYIVFYYVAYIFSVANYCIYAIPDFLQSVSMVVLSINYVAAQCRVVSGLCTPTYWPIHSAIYVLWQTMPGYCCVIHSK